MMSTRKIKSNIVEVSLPGINSRVQNLIDHFAEGNITKFSEMVNEAVPERLISQQVLSRLFISKEGRYPNVSDSIIRAITKRFVEVDVDWLLHGKGHMLKINTIEFDLAASVKKTEATTAVILSAISELLAKETGQSATVVKGQLQDLVNKQLGL